MDKQLTGQDDAALSWLTTHLNLAQEQMKKFVDRRKVEMEFEEVDWVYLKFWPYR